MFLSFEKCCSFWLEFHSCSNFLFTKMRKQRHLLDRYGYCFCNFQYAGKIIPIVSIFCNLSRSDNAHLGKIQCQKLHLVGGEYHPPKILTINTIYGRPKRSCCLHSLTQHAWHGRGTPCWSEEVGTPIMGFRAWWESGPMPAMSQTRSCVIPVSWGLKYRQFPMFTHVKANPVFPQVASVSVVKSTEVRLWSHPRW